VAGVAVVVAGVAFGIFGGEYSTIDLWTLGRDVREQERAIIRLDAEIDSLTERARLLEHDSATQERAAREKFGMIRDGEILYRVEPAPR
jgi:cell division protein FtsB